MVPYRDNGHLTRAQIHFNYRLSTCRVIAEHFIGILKQRFRQLYHLKLRNIVRMVQIILLVVFYAIWQAFLNVI